MTDGLDLLEPLIEPLINVSVLFGHIAIGSRIRWEGSRGIGEGRSWHYDGKCALVKDTGWQPTGMVVWL